MIIISTDLPSNIVSEIMVDCESNRALGTQNFSISSYSFKLKHWHNYLYTVRIMQKMIEFKGNSLTNLFLNSVFKWDLSSTLRWYQMLCNYYTNMNKTVYVTWAYKGDNWRLCLLPYQNSQSVLPFLICCVGTHDSLDMYNNSFVFILYICSVIFACENAMCDIIFFNLIWYMFSQNYDFSGDVMK